MTEWAAPHWNAMKPASRSMPPLERQTASPWAGRLCLAGLGGALVWWLWTYPRTAGALLGLVWCMDAISRRLEKKHFVPLAQARAGQSICDFARSIDCRRVDTWVVRAVYEELQANLAHHGLPLPVRLTDRLHKDLRLDADDLDLSLVPDIAQRAGRDLSSTQANPFFGKVITVGDLVHFMNAQPRLSAAV